MRGKIAAARALESALVALSVWFLVAAEVSAQSGFIALVTPSPSASLRGGDQVFVSGRVLDFNGTPIGGESVIALLLDPQGVAVPGTQGSSTSSPNDGSFSIAIDVPADLEGGEYTLRVESPGSSILPATVRLTIRSPPAPPLEQPAWAPGLVVIASAAAAAAVVVFLRYTSRRPSAK